MATDVQEPVAEDGAVPEVEASPDTQVGDVEASEDGSEPQGESGESIKARWATDTAERERKNRDLSTVNKEQEARIAELAALVEKSSDPVKAIMEGGRTLEDYRKLTAAFGASAESKELTVEEQLRADLDSLTAERKSEKDAHTEAVTKQAHTNALASAKTFVDASEDYGFTKALGMSSAMLSERSAMHKEGMREITDVDVAKRVESSIADNVANQMDALLLVPAFQELLKAKLAKTSEPARQATQGTESEETQPLQTLSNALSGADASETDWESMPDDERRAHTRKAIKQAMAESNGLAS